MKKTLLATLALTAAIALHSAPAFAHEDHPEANPPKKEEKAKPAASAEAHGHGHSHAAKIPAAVEDIWKEIHAQQAKLVRTVEEKKLSSAHDSAFAIRDLVKALPGKVAAESKAKAEEGAKTIAKLASDIDKSGAAGAQKTTEANVKKLGETIVALQASLKTK